MESSTRTLIVAGVIAAVLISGVLLMSRDRKEESGEMTRNEVGSRDLEQHRDPPPRQEQQADPHPAQEKRREAEWDAPDQPADERRFEDPWDAPEDTPEPPQEQVEMVAPVEAKPWPADESGVAAALRSNSSLMQRCFQMLPQGFKVEGEIYITGELTTTEDSPVGFVQDTYVEVPGLNTDDSESFRMCVESLLNLKPYGQPDDDVIIFETTLPAQPK